MNFSVFVPRSRQMGRVVDGLMPAPPIYRSLNERRNVRNPIRGRGNIGDKQFSDSNGEAISTKVTESENTRP